ncbi:hypothetical protein GKZ68_05850 [Hymenobacter sp. BRD128]|uniref:YDG/SRA domain-containing protein n=1 Tax=Hymenobacter sp. BRD128 TaxID=2675878 RepID=UPI001566BCEB|nr:YDG/SRA domain-containing protein [Hymenobacter sp. BRD128]QKG56207.1 hypothetical protein GKZ68_05850 [Hymenobacter sp. BRD128]
MAASPVFGHVGTAQPGDLFASRLELSLRGQHRPRRAGVGATAALGAESIVLAEQYEDDAYHDDHFWYAGSGGRDPKTGRQVTDQAPNDYRNQGLMRSERTGQPVRVFRRIAPGGDRQFRYEGLWQVVAHTYGPGKSGFQVFRFKLKPWQ